jgi:tetratricopeptide (TPR) repeat protein
MRFEMTRLMFLAALALLATAVVRPAAGQPRSPEPGEKPEATSLDGKPLYRSPLIPPDQEQKLEDDLKKAEADYARDPKNPEFIIWLGRRLGYLHRYHEAVDAFSKGIDLYPNDARFYRFRGHRYITLRDFDRAVADLERAASLIRGKPDEEEPSGTGGSPSTLHFNVWYHLGLARYLKGEFGMAVEPYLECMKVSEDDESKAATSDWLYMTYRRNGDESKAAAVLEPIREGMDIKENTAYYQRLLMYKGLVPPDAVLNPEGAEPLQVATQGYGVANWYFYRGEKEKARQLFEKVVAVGYWPAFGHIAAEAELAR